MSEPVHPGSQLRLRLCGGLRVERNGERLAPHEVGSRKGRMLLHILAVERGRQVSTGRLVEALWGANPPARPADNVASLASRLRGLLGADVIEGGRGGYRLVTGPRLVVDLDEAFTLVAEAETRLAAGEPALGYAAAQRAVELLGDAPAGDAPEEPWAADTDAEAARLLRRARGVAWETALALGRHRRAAELATAALAADLFDEEAARALMRAQHRAGEPAAALMTYEQLRARLAEDLGVDPSPETRAVHLAILREEAAPDPPLATTTASPATGDAGQPELVGREQELAWLEAAWAGVLTKGASLVLVTGEAGIGKTRLAAEAAQRAAATGGVVLRSRCYRAERSLFLQPVLEAVREVAVSCPPDVLRDLAGEWAATLGNLVPELADVLRPLRQEPSMPEVERRRAFEGVTAFFRRLAQRHPVFVLLDDLQHAGEATIELLHYTVRRLSAPLLVVATLRSDEGAEWRERLHGTADVLEVGPLAPAAVTALAAQMGAAHLGARLLERTGGHPLFLVEALRAAAERGGGLDVQGVPDTLRAVVLARVRALGPDVEELLRAAVVIGTAFDVATVADLVGIGPGEASRRAERALRAHLLTEAGADYVFANDLIREAVYETTPQPTRVARHRRAAELLAGNPEAMATHLTAIGDWSAAMTAWEQAAERAASAFATRDAEQLYTEALSVAALVDDPLATARVRLARGRVREGLGDYMDAHDDHATALMLAKAAGDQALEAAALERLGWTAYYARDDPALAAFTARAHEYAERAAAAPASGAGALVLVGRLRHAEGDLAPAEEALRAVLTGDLDVRTRALAQQCYGLLLEHTDRYADARAALEAAIADSRRGGFARNLVTGEFGAAMADANEGDFGSALRRVEAMERALRHFDDPLYRARVATTRSWIWRELGDPGLARDQAQEALELTGGSRASRHTGIHAEMAAAECALVEGEGAEAARLLATSRSALDIPFFFSWRARLRHLELCARLEPAVAEELLSLARSHGSAKYEALALAHLDRREEASAAAQRTGSDYLLAMVASPAEARPAFERIAGRLPPELRGRFLERGLLARRMPLE